MPHTEPPSSMAVFGKGSAAADMRDAWLEAALVVVAVVIVIALLQ